MAERKTTIYYNHNFYYDFSQIIAADDRGLQFGDGCYEWIRVYKGQPSVPLHASFGHSSRDSAG